MKQMLKNTTLKAKGGLVTIGIFAATGVTALAQDPTAPDPVAKLGELETVAIQALIAGVGIAVSFLGWKLARKFFFRSA